MNPMMGWGLALAALAAGWFNYGWQGVIMAASVIVFWLLLQFTRAMRTMKTAAKAPKGRVDSAVMLNAKLKPGMTLLQVLAITHSLGVRVSETPETWRWQDDGGSHVTLEFDRHAKLVRWTLDRPVQAD